MAHKKFQIRKRIAKHGKDHIIIIPSILKDILRHKTVVDLTIEVISQPEVGDENERTNKN